MITESKIAFHYKGQPVEELTNPFAHYEQTFADLLKEFTGLEPSGKRGRPVGVGVFMTQKLLAQSINLDQASTGRLLYNARKPSRDISFWENLRSAVNPLTDSRFFTDQQIVAMVRSNNGPRWLKPTDKTEADKAAKDFGNLFKKYRTRVGLSNLRLAPLLGVDESTTNRIDSGIRKPSTGDVLDQLPTVLKLSDKEYATMLLTGKPPLWLVPHLYAVIGVHEALKQTLTISPEELIKREYQIPVRDKIIHLAISYPEGTLPNEEMIALGDLLRRTADKRVKTILEDL